MTTMENGRLHIMDDLVGDFVEWVAAGERSYAEVMESWSTYCPLLSVWEEAIDRRLLVRERRGDTTMIRLTPAGRALIRGRPLLG
ncbi:MAG: hypothetical protein WD034_02060 [Parvibaculum sp.]|uniref:hypothetical protein n=1 Tax=Parvibaculum sp. TaxID=2024848 RepID=UPI0034A06FAF